MSEINKEREGGERRDEGLPVLNGPEGELQPEGSRWGKAHHVLLYFLAGALVVWVLTGIYRVEANEVGLVERMGEFVSVEEPGKHFGMPWPIDMVHHVPMKQALSLSVVEFDTSTAANEEMKKDFLKKGWPKLLLDAMYDPYLITADKNVLNAKIAVQYQIVDPQAYLTSIYGGAAARDEDWEKGVREAIGKVASHVLIREMAKMGVDDTLRGGKEVLMQRLREAMGPETEKLHLGIRVDNVTLEVHWPMAVDDAFKSVQQAMFNAKGAVENAKTYAERVLTQAAMGDANRILSEAQAYQKKVVEDAKGEADRFNQVYAQYKESPELTRMSLYSDAVNTVLGNVSRTIFVQPGQKPTVVIDAPDDKKR